MTAGAVIENSPDRGPGWTGRPAARRPAARTVPRTPVTAPGPTQQLVDPVPVVEGDQPGLGRLLGRGDERLDHAGAGAPGDVEAGHRVAVAVGAQVAALGPADGRQERDARARPARRASPPRRTRRTRGPTAPPRRPRRPGGRTARCPASRSRPARPSRDAEPALLRAVDEEQPAERPVRLAAEVGGVLLVEQGDPLARGRSARAWRPARPARPRRRSRPRPWAEIVTRRRPPAWQGGSCAST